MRWIDDDRQVRALLHVGHGVEIERVAGRGLEGADAALAQDHLIVAGGEDIFRREQQLLDLRGEAALQQDRLVGPPDGAQQREILHVARADLQRVGMGRDDVDIGGVHNLGHDRHGQLVRHLAQQLEPLGPVAAEAIGAGARLVRPGAKHLRPRRPDGAGAVEQLLAGFDRAGAGDHRHRAAAEGDAADRDDRVVRMEVARDKLVGGKDRLHRFDVRVAVERELGEHPFVAERAEHHALGPRHVERLEAGGRNAVEQPLGGLGGGVRLEDDDHRDFLGDWAIKNPPVGRV